MSKRASSGPCGAARSGWTSPRVTWAIPPTGASSAATRSSRWIPGGTWCCECRWESNPYIGRTDVAVRIPAADPAALVRIRLLAAAAVLVAVAALRFYESPAVATWLYVLAWYPTLLILDQVVVLRGGASLLAQPRALVTMLWWSAVIWFLFEAINFRLQDWYYVFLPASLPERWIGITLSLATVVPAVLLPERLLDRLGRGARLRARPLPLRAQDLRVAFWGGWGAPAGALPLPRYFQDRKSTRLNSSH